MNKTDTWTGQTADEGRKGGKEGSLTWGAESCGGRKKSAPSHLCGGSHTPRLPRSCHEGGRETPGVPSGLGRHRWGSARPPSLHTHPGKGCYLLWALRHFTGRQRGLNTRKPIQTKQPPHSLQRV